MPHKCSICKLEFSDAELARQCEAWCSTHNGCNLEIARQAINKATAYTAADQRFNGGK